MENGSVVLADNPPSTPLSKSIMVLANMENGSVVLAHSPPSTPPGKGIMVLANMENGSVVLADSPPSTPLSKIIMVSAIGAGVQFGWALQLSLLTPYVQQLGVPHIWTSFIWLCGPISGLLVQPIVGYYSDRCTSRIGRRRPFIIGGAFFVALSVFFIGYAADIGHALGDDLSKTMKPRAVAIYVVGFWILDVANNMLQGPCRAFLADLSGNNHRKVRLSNGFFAFFMGVGNLLGYGAGSYGGLHKFLPFTETKACDVNCANLKTCFIIEILLLVAVTVLAVSTVSEIPLVKKKENEKSEPFFKQLGTAFKQLSRHMWLLFLVTAFNWIAWFSFLLYDTDWMGLDVYGGKPTGTGQEVRIYDMGVRAGALGLVINSVVLGFASLAVEPISRGLKGAKNWWGIVNLMLAIAMCMTVFVSKAAEQWRSANGLHPPPSHIKAGAFTIFAILGIPLSVNYSVPWALASIYSESCGAGQGLSVGLLNLVVVIPQMIVSMVSGPLDAAFGGGNSAAFVMGGIAAAVSAVLALTILPKTGRQSSSSFVMGGH